MCGIAGIFRRGSADDIRRMLDCMATTQSHRGPDGSGTVVFANRDGRELSETDDDRDALGGLAHRRLAIIDLSERASQPMRDATGRWWLAYNGEVYNYRELRVELKGCGHQFLSDSDTEVVLRALIEWGIGAFAKFNGMWALAFWDAEAGELLLSRDRFGIKPLYVHENSAGPAFASELPALLELPGVRVSAHDQAVADYLVHGKVDAFEFTFFQGIRRVPAGHCLRWFAKTQAMQTERWWDLETAALSADAGVGWPDWTVRFRELFTDAVRLRLRSDVPVGTCLSGGLDSSAVLRTAAPLLADDCRNAFSARFPGAEKDETDWIERAAEGVSIHQHWVMPTSEELIADLPALLRHQGEPFGSSSVYAQWRVFQLARETGVPVTLDGQGADETLAGYLYFLPVYHAELFYGGQWRRWFAETGAAARLHGGGRFTYLMRSVAGVIGHRRMIRLARWVSPAYRFNWVAPGVRDAAADLSAPVSFRGGRLNGRLAEVFSRTGLPALLRYADRNSMAHSVESRMPFLDHRLVSLLFAMPPEAKILDGQTKAVLRRALHDTLPSAIRDRQDKVGFETPQAGWFRQVLRPEIEKMLDAPSLFSDVWVRRAQLRVMLEDHRLRRRDFSRPLWRFFNIEKWATTFL